MSRACKTILALAVGTACLAAWPSPLDAQPVAPANKPASVLPQDWDLLPLKDFTALCESLSDNESGHVADRNKLADYVRKNYVETSDALAAAAPDQVITLLAIGAPGLNGRQKGQLHDLLLQRFATDKQVQNLSLKSVARLAGPLADRLLMTPGQSRDWIQAWLAARQGGATLSLTDATEACEMVARAHRLAPMPETLRGLVGIIWDKYLQKKETWDGIDNAKEVLREYTCLADELPGAQRLTLWHLVWQRLNRDVRQTASQLDWRDVALVRQQIVGGLNLPARQLVPLASAVVVAQAGASTPQTLTDGIVFLTEFRHDPRHEALCTRAYQAIGQAVLDKLAAPKPLVEGDETAVRSQVRRLAEVFETDAQRQQLQGLLASAEVPNRLLAGNILAWSYLNAQRLPEWKKQLMAWAADPNTQSDSRALCLLLSGDADTVAAVALDMANVPLAEAELKLRCANLEQAVTLAQSEPMRLRVAEEVAAFFKSAGIPADGVRLLASQMGTLTGKAAQRVLDLEHDLEHEDANLSKKAAEATTRRAEFQSLWEKQLQTKAGWEKITDVKEVMNDYYVLAEILPETERQTLRDLVWTRLNADVAAAGPELDWHAVFVTRHQILAGHTAPTRELLPLASSCVASRAATFDLNALNEAAGYLADFRNDPKLEALCAPACQAVAQALEARLAGPTAMYKAENGEGTDGQLGQLAKAFQTDAQRKELQGLLGTAAFPNRLVVGKVLTWSYVQAQELPEWKKQLAGLATPGGTDGDTRALYLLLSAEAERITPKVPSPATTAPAVIVATQPDPMLQRADLEQALAAAQTDAMRVWVAEAVAAYFQNAGIPGEGAAVLASHAAKLNGVVPEQEEVLGQRLAKAQANLDLKAALADARRAELQGLWDKELQTKEGWDRIADAQEVLRDYVGLAAILPESQRPILAKLVWERLNANVDQTLGELDWHDVFIARHEVALPALQLAAKDTVPLAARFLILRAKTAAPDVLADGAAVLADFRHDPQHEGACADAYQATAQAVDNLAPTNSGTITPYAKFGYLGVGTIYQVAHPAVTATGNLVLNYDPSGDGSYSGLDQFGQVVDQNWVVNSAAVDRYQYGYDRNGNRLYRNNMLSSTNGELYHVNGSTGGYDGLDRLTDFRRGTLSASGSVLDTVTTAGHTFNWALDELGNWASVTTDGGTPQTRTHTAANETATTTGGSWATLGYDTAGNMTSGPQPGAEGTGLTFVYDAWNRLVAVKNAAGTTTLATYAYNGLNQRIQKVVPSGGSNVTTDFYYNEAWQVLEEQKTVGAGSPATYAQYVWDPRYIDAPVCRFRDPTLAGSLSETLYYTNDANMNVTALVNTSADVVERYRYDPYGNIIFLQGAKDLSGAATTDGGSRSASIADSQILYAGYRYDPESGLFHVRNRYYHPTLGRWITRDLEGYVDGAALYEACGSSPCVYSDPTGTSIVLSCDASAEAYFTILGVQGYKTYQDSPRRGLTEYSGTSVTYSTAGEKVNSEIVAKMISSTHRFEVKAGTLANLELHVDARLNIIAFADAKKYRLGVGEGFHPNPTFWNTKTGAPIGDYFAALQDLKEGKYAYAVSCLFATKNTVLGGIADTLGSSTAFKQAIADAGGEANLRPTYDANKFDAWDEFIPGDWAWIENTTGSKYRGQEGENIIYVGNGNYWGHVEDVQTYKKSAEWMAAVRGWGSPRLGTARNYPSIGLINTR